MAEQPNTPAFDPDEALRLLDQAWAYFTPGQPEHLPASPYDDLSVAV